MGVGCLDLLKKSDRLLETEVAREFLITLTSLGQVRLLLSSDHFSFDGTMIDAWASMKSFRPRDGSDDPPGAGPQRRAHFSRPVQHRHQRLIIDRRHHQPPPTKTSYSASGRNMYGCGSGSDIAARKEPRPAWSTTCSRRPSHRRNDRPRSRQWAHDRRQIPRASDRRFLW